MLPFVGRECCRLTGHRTSIWLRQIYSTDSEARDHLNGIKVRGGLETVHRLIEPGVCERAG